VYRSAILTTTDAAIYAFIPNIPHCDILLCALTQRISMKFN